MTRRAGDWVPTICKGGGMRHAPEDITRQTFLNQEHPSDPMPHERGGNRVQARDSATILTNSIGGCSL